MRYLLFVFTFIAAGSSVFEQLFNFSTPYHVVYNNAGSGVQTISRCIVETAADSTKPIEQMSTMEKMYAHIVHFTGAVMSDTFVLSHFSRAFVADQYSDFLKPGKYPDGNASVPNAIASSLDGIAIPPKTRLVVYNKLHLTGTILIDITGPAIVNNGIFESSDFYAVANKKSFSRELQEIFPPKVRQWTGSGNNSMSYWQSFSFEILVVS